jgi:hypothetical protein
LRIALAGYEHTTTCLEDVSDHDTKNEAIMAAWVLHYNRYSSATRMGIVALRG